MKNIAVISGGYSHESLISKKSVKTILKHLDTNLYNLYHIKIDENGWKYVNKGIETDVNRDDFTIIDNRLTITFDFAYIIIHGTPGEDGKLQSYFDMLNIPYNTPNHLVSTITFNKWACNTLLKSLGYNVAESIIIRPNQSFDTNIITEKLGLPVFIKPCDGGSSYGVTRVTETSQIEHAITEAFQHGTEVIIESELKGTEITNGIFADRKHNITVLPITEIVSENDFFDFEAKYNGKSNEVTPARLSDTVTEEVKRLTKSIYQDLGMSGLVRIDYIIVDNIPFVIEVNTTPGMSSESIIPQQVKVQNLILQNVLAEVIESKLSNV